jgi:hypothetical protein
MDWRTARDEAIRATLKNRKGSPMFRTTPLSVYALAALLVFPLAASGAPEAIPQWFSGFENGWPGEWLNYAGPDQGGSTDWTILNAAEAAADGVEVVEGSHISKAWINSASSSSHRAYPVINSNVPSPFVNRFYVWLDWDPQAYASYTWISLMTLANTSDWNVVTISTLAKTGVMEAAHVGSYNGFDSGDGWERVGTPIMPLREWVPFTVYTDFRAAGDVMYVWMDGELILKANGGNLNQLSTTLSRAHWGLYASGAVDDAVMYNDSIQIWSLTEAWTDLEHEPPSPYESHVAGDVNGDGVVDDADIDLLFAEIRSGDGNLYYDLTGDDVLNQTDADYLVRFLLGTDYGDANLDGQVSDADYTVWADHYGATGAGWAMGDFNGNTSITEADYTIWADQYGFSASAVPEPTILVLMAMTCVGLRRR